MPVSHPDLPPLILASASPRRAEILGRLGIDFRVEAADMDEAAFIRSLGDGAPPEFIGKALLLARAKAELVGEGLCGEGLVLGADTTVVLDDGRDLGKPRDDAEAREMLSALSGRSHRVVTGTVLMDASTGARTESAPVTVVRMRTLSRRILDAYVASGEPEGKAGAYAIQGLGGLLIAGVRGSHTNVVGLPVEVLEELFSGLGYSVWDYVL